MFQKPYPPMSCPSGDGRNMVWDDPAKRLVFAALNGKMYRNIIGATSDGASVPQAGWCVIPPFGLTYWLAAVLHDWLYRGMVEVSEDMGKTWKRVMVPKDECDSLLMEAMGTLGADEFTRETIYQAVNHFGYGAYGDDAAEPIKI